MAPAARLRLFYALYYGAVGANLPYFAAYLRGLGFSGEAIGTVQMAGPLLAPAVALAWGAAADRLGAPA
ncbi:MAG TPA: MFS transporter, partial [Anaeromyxobacteraceae bacterium]|nr:MFS transporter [Anaeromyxobacteraceae bacterium]